MSSQPTAPPLVPNATLRRGEHPWRPWTLPLDAVRMQRELCGLLNRVTKANFDAIAARTVRWAVDVEVDGNQAMLETFVRAVFCGGARDRVRRELYVALCVRIVDELESERNLWKRVDPYHVGNPLCTFETVIRLMPNIQFHRIVTERDSEELFSFVTLVAELLVQGILYAEDTQDILGFLLDLAGKGDANAAIGIRRFLGPIIKAFNATHLLAILDVATGMERVLQAPDLPSIVRSTLQTVLDQVAYPQPPDAFNSSSERIAAYGFASDSEASLMDTDEVDMDRLRQSCRERAAIFFEKRTHAFAERALEDLHLEHRHLFFRQLIADVLRQHDLADARLVGSLWLLETTHKLCEEGQAFLQGLEAELLTLPDTVLDAPDACRTLSAMLHETPLDVEMLEALVWQCLPSDGALREHLLGELRAQERANVEGISESSRRNRFERTTSDKSASSSGFGYAY